MQTLLFITISLPRNGPPTLSRLWASHYGSISRNSSPFFLFFFLLTCTYSARLRAFAFVIENRASLTCCRTETQSDSPPWVEAPHWLPPIAQTALYPAATPESPTSPTSTMASSALRTSLSTSSDSSPRKRSRTTWTNSLSELRSSALWAGGWLAKMLSCASLSLRRLRHGLTSPDANDTLKRQVACYVLYSLHGWPSLRLWSFVCFLTLISAFFPSQHPSLYRRSSYDCCLSFLQSPFHVLSYPYFSFFFRISLWRFDLMRCALFPWVWTFGSGIFLPFIFHVWLSRILNYHENFLQLHLQE